jgi:hypothetical protein
MILRPGVIVGRAGPRGTLGLILNRDSSPEQMFLLSCAHVLSASFIDSDCVTAPSGKTISAYSTLSVDQGGQSIDVPGAFPVGPADTVDIGTIVEQTCLTQRAPTHADSTITTVDQPQQWDAILADPIDSAPPPSASQFRLVKSNIPTGIAGLPICRFGARTGVARGSLTGLTDSTVRLTVFNIPIDYDGLIEYQTVPSGQEGDSGALVAILVSSPALGVVGLAPFGIHVGASDVDPSKNYCFPLQPIFDRGWQVAYERPA